MLVSERGNIYIVLDEVRIIFFFDEYEYIYVGSSQVFLSRIGRVLSKNVDSKASLRIRRNVSSGEGIRD